MAKPATKKISTPKKVTTPSRAKATADRYDPSKARAVLGKLTARDAVPTDVEVEAFSSLASEAQCAELGAKTRARGVLNDGVRWAVLMDRALEEYPGALPGYSRRRFAWFLASLSTLADRIDGADAKRGHKDNAAGSASAARSRAVEARKTLASQLRTFAGLREDKRRDLAAALGKADENENLGKSIAALAALATRWIGQTDPPSTVLAANAGLTKEGVDAALGAAKALTASARDATLAPAARAQDPAEVNVAEGRVLVEMREAYRLFSEAHEKNRVVPKLSPGPATRHAVARRGGSGATEDEMDGDGETGAGMPAAEPETKAKTPS